MTTTSHLNVPCLLDFLKQDDGEIVLEQLLRENPGGISRLATSKFFEYELEGDQVIFSEESRAFIEAAIGTPLEEVQYPGFALETALAVPPPQRDELAAFLRAWRVRRPSAGG